MAETMGQGLTVPLEKLGYIIEKARTFDAEVAPYDENARASDDDEEVDDILEATRSNPTYLELITALDLLNDDECDEAVALTWLGRGDYSKSDWDSALTAARERHNGREAEYLAGTPLLADYLEEGVSQLGYSMKDLESGNT